MGLMLRGKTFDDRVHAVAITAKDYEAQRVEIITWLFDNFGSYEGSGLWDMWEWAANEKVYFSFRYEDHAMAFKLAWT